MGIWPLYTKILLQCRVQQQPALPLVTIHIDSDIQTGVLFLFVYANIYLLKNINSHRMNATVTFKRVGPVHMPVRTFMYLMKPSFFYCFMHRLFCENQ